ncbi:MAG TPA: DUF6174 domain-containing protein [Nocardioides sp.]|uniref:DUF6174 domain-containing protein n=1 Tax=Nocardioides sp. TaxID=35761 RepID=UPI002C3DC825|nr:DUF6174 domain-containing protein [Nocardioides sp.]HQR28054.1 DUF6174 domain-containing protein [Nocardioides sp.]
MRRPHVLAVTAVLLAALTACGSTTQESGEATGSASPSGPGSGTPTVGSYPAYPHQDYAYTLVISCFCPDAGQPIRITVRDGRVVSAVYAQRGRGHRPGDAVTAEYQRKTLDDVIAAANNTEADRVEVLWPAGQDYPTSVYVDALANAVDEEIGFTVSRVRPLD